MGGWLPSEANAKRGGLYRAGRASGGGGVECVVLLQRLTLF